MSQSETALDTRAAQSLSLEGLRNEIVRLIQSTRKQVGCEVTQRVKATFSTDDEYVYAAAHLNEDYIKRECQLIQLVLAKDGNSIKIKGKAFDFNPSKWHTPVCIKDNDLHYGAGYPHYWAALKAWSSNETE